MARNRFSFLHLAFLLCVLLCHGQGQPVDSDGKTSHSPNVGGDDASGSIAPENKDGGDTRTFGIIARQVLNDAEIKEKLMFPSEPFNYVVITDDIEEKKHEIEKTPVDDLHNFYIGNDGTVYEGRGWGISKDFERTDIEKWSLWVSFLNKFQDSSASSPAVEALKSLIKEAVSLGKLTPDYKLISNRLFYEDPYFLGDKIHEEMKSWDHYSDQVDIYSGREYEMAGLFPVVFREEWNASKSNVTLEAISVPIENVVVASFAIRCFAMVSCAEIMQADQNAALSNNTDLSFNFYVAENGYAFESRGWDWVPSAKNVTKNTMVVAFLGQFHSFKPSRPAFLAFQKLLRLGVWLGKISPSYKILSVRNIGDETHRIGEQLQNEIMKMDRFSNDM